MANQTTDLSDISTITNKSKIEWLVKAYLSALQNYCKKLTGSQWEAEDLAQDTLLKALAKLTHHDNPKAYLFRIAKNAWIDQCRKQQRAEDCLFEEQMTGEAGIDTTAIIDAMSILIRHLTPLQRIVLLLRDVFELSSSEVADVIGATEGAVKAALHRARHNLTLLKEAQTEERMFSEAEEENHKEILNAYLTAFRNYDIEALVTLAQNDIVHPVQALNSLWTSAILHRQNRTRSVAPSDSTALLLVA